MLVLTEAESREWLTRQGLGNKLTKLGHENARCDFERDFGRRFIYSNLLTNELITNENALACLDITDWAVWPTIQNMDLFYAYRRSFGEYRPLIEAHFHVFTAAEANVMRNILHLSLLSLFDVAGASTTTDFRFYASHDEWIELLWSKGAPWISEMDWFFQK